MKVHDNASTTHEFGSLSDEAKALLSATIGVSDEKVSEARKRLSAALDRSKEAWARVQDRAVQGAKATDHTIRTHPYQAIGVAFGIGALLGVILSRRG